MHPFIETIRIEEGQVYNLAYHTQRLNRTRAAFQKGLAPIDLSKIISAQNRSGLYKCRVIYGEEIEEITYLPYEMRRVQSLRLLSCDTIDYTYKQLNRDALNHLFAQRGTADDILIVKHGCLTDTSIANIAVYEGHTWFTPVAPLLCGTKRAELLDKQLVVEKEIRVSELGRYTHIMLFNALIDWGKIVLPITSDTIIHQNCI